MPNRWLVPVILGLALLAPAAASAQRLGGVSSAVHGGGGGFHSSGGSSGYRSSGYGYRGGGYGGYGYGGYGGGGAQIGLSPWVSLYYPYYMGYVGVGVRQSAMAADRTFTAPDVIGIVDASAGYVLDSVVRGQVSARLRLTGIVDFEARYGAYFEQTSDAIRELGIGRVAVVFPFVSEDVVQLRGGVVGQLYHDAVGIELGFAGTLELDAYPVEPLVLRAEVAFGQLGQASMIDARATLGFQIDRGELYLGYQVFAVDPFGRAGDALHGPIAGVRVWIS